MAYVRVHRKRPKTIEFNTRIQSYESQSVATIKAHSDQIMAKKRKRKKKEPENEAYEIEIEDWETAYHFAMNTMPKDLVEGVYWEHSMLILTGKILSPALEKATKARVEIADDPQLDDHWKPEPTIISAKAIGWMGIPRGDDKLIFHCSIPSRSLPHITIAVCTGKIKYVSIFGTKLKWRKGTISSLSLSKDREEDYDS